MLWWIEADSLRGFEVDESSRQVLMFLIIYLFISPAFIIWGSVVQSSDNNIIILEALKKNGQTNFERKFLLQGLPFEFKK